MSAPPNLMSLNVTHSWFGEVSRNRFKEKLIKMWQPGEGVLYTWVEWIQNAEFLSELELLSVDESGDGIIRCVYLI